MLGPVPLGEDIAHAVHEVVSAGDHQLAVHVENGPDVVPRLEPDMFQLRAVGFEEASAVTEIERCILVQVVRHRPEVADECLLVDGEKGGGHF